MVRRAFLASAISAARATAAQPVLRNATLVHEHILVDFIGADKVSPDRYQRSDVFRRALPFLQDLRSLGCTRLLECTPNFLGRDPLLLRQLARASGIQIWTNTGLYAANRYQHLPPYAYTETAEQLAARWILEVRRGVNGLQPRFIKIGVNRGPLPEIDRKLIRAAALTSLATGLTIAAHTGDGRAALDQLDEITQLKLPPHRFVWVHAQNELEHQIRIDVARAGAWVELDAVNEKSADRHLDCLERLASANLLNRILISQDSGWYHVGEPDGGDFRPYTYLFTHFLPRLQPGWAHRLLVDNPTSAFGR
jgi:phosphotriesterase-related protein